MKRYAIGFWDENKSCPGVNFVRGNSEKHAIKRWEKELARLNIEGRQLRSIVDASDMGVKRIGKECYFVY